MAKKTKRFRSGGSAVPLQNLDYNLLSGGGSKENFRLSPTIMRQPSSELSRLTGTSPPKGVGVKGTVRFKKGGSAASKRADGCATKGKTKGRFV